MGFCTTILCFSQIPPDCFCTQCGVVPFQKYLGQEPAVRSGRNYGLSPGPLACLRTAARCTHDRWNTFPHLTHIFFFPPFHETASEQFFKKNDKTSLRFGYSHTGKSVFLKVILCIDEEVWWWWCVLWRGIKSHASVSGHLSGRLEKEESSRVCTSLFIRAFTYKFAVGMKWV